MDNSIDATVLTIRVGKINLHIKQTITIPRHPKREVDMFFSTLFDITMSFIISLHDHPFIAITMNSAITVLNAVPLYDHIGIKIRFRITFTTAVISVFFKIAFSRFAGIKTH